MSFVTPISRLFPPQYGAVAAGSTPKFTATIVDENGNGVAAANINTLTLSIVDVSTAAIVNTCSTRDIKNVGRGTVDSSGNLTIVLTAADTALVNLSDQQEERALVIDYTYNTSTRTGRYEIRFIVQNLSGP